MEDMRAALHRARAALRYDGLWWRHCAYLGSAYGPEWWKRGSPPVIATIIFALIGPNRRGAAANMRQVLGTADPLRAHAAALRVFVEFAHCLSETLESFSPREQPVRIELPAADLIDRALRDGRGAVLVTGHLGNWDIAAKALADYDRPINLVMGRELNHTTREYVRTARERAGVRVIYSDTSALAALNMVRALRDNELVAIQLDRRRGHRGVHQIPFFGRPAAFPTGPFMLARITGAPVIPVFAPRLGKRHYAIRYGTPVSLPRERPETAALGAAMRSVVADFEAVIREFPHQWFQFTPFWPRGAA
ncbi:MAG: lysophospholipid acyltransferase family protein [Candidatus Binatia bacterium]